MRRVTVHKRRDSSFLKLLTYRSNTFAFFSFSDGPTYETTNSSTVWVKSSSSGLDKRQCTVQLTVFADGCNKVKPLVIFKGKDERISFHEQLQYDKQVFVRFQPNAWCSDEVVDQELLEAIYSR